MLEFDVRIKTDGKVVHEVTNRNGQDCRKIEKIVQRMGKVVSDETTGPFCDKVNETSGTGER